MVSGKGSEFPRLAPAAGPSPEGSPVFFGVTMPRRRPQGWWCSRGLFDDLDISADFDELLRHIMDVYDVSSDSEDEDFDELIEYYDNQRW
jgi:hypothetical protein